MSKVSIPPRFSDAKPPASVLTSRKRILAAWSVVLLATIAVGVFEYGVESRLARQRRALETRLAAESAANAAVRDRLARQTRELAQAERELGELTGEGASADGARRADIRAWLARVHTLQQLFADHPAQRIPEMQWLTDEAWLRVARFASLGSDDGIRQAMAEIRTWAKTGFGQVAREAIRRAQADSSIPPGSAVALAPYFNPPVDPAVLDRYEIQRSIEGLRVIGSDDHLATFVMTEKAPVDDVFDARCSFNSAGTVVRTPGPESWSAALRQTISRATRAYAKANPGAADPEMKDLIRYAEPPLDQATADKLLKAEQARTQRR